MEAAVGCLENINVMAVAEHLFTEAKSISYYQYYYNITLLVFLNLITPPPLPHTHTHNGCHHPLP